MVDVFREVRRVLRHDGTAWVNFGDSYAGGQLGRKDTSRIHAASVDRKGIGYKAPNAVPTGLKGKDLVGIPWRVAFALQDDGWYLRSDIIWAKPNPMPESVTDRPTKAHEYIFLLSKRERYYYDAAAIREPAKDRPVSDFRNGSAYVNQCAAPSNHQRTDKQRGHSRRHAGFNDRWDGMTREEQQSLGSNKRTVWNVATHPYPDAHFATFPPKLIEPCILAGSSPQACEHCGAPWKRIVEAVGGTIGKSWHDHKDDMGAGMSQIKESLGNVALQKTYRRIERGWRPTCKCKENTGAARCIVLDPFMGSGTTAMVATQWQRDYLGIELNATYIEMAYRRLSQVPVRLFAEGAAI